MSVDAMMWLLVHGAILLAIAIVLVPRYLRRRRRNRQFAEMLLRLGDEHAEMKRKIQDELFKGLL